MDTGRVSVLRLGCSHSVRDCARATDTRKRRVSGAQLLPRLRPVSQRRDQFKPAARSRLSWHWGTMQAHPTCHMGQGVFVGSRRHWAGTYIVSRMHGQSKRGAIVLHGNQGV